MSEFENAAFGVRHDPIFLDAAHEKNAARDFHAVLERFKELSHFTAEVNPPPTSLA